MPKVRTAILISGRGSNMLKLIEAAKTPDYPADICLVLSNRPKAAGLKLAQQHGIPALSIDHTTYTTREGFEAEMQKVLAAHDIEFIACAGFMRILSPNFTQKWAGRIINIHPSLLPKYKGLHTHRRALDANDTQHGCTVHWVNSGVDEGKIIASSRLNITPKDTVQSLEQRVQKLEHLLYPQTLKALLQD